MSKKAIKDAKPLLNPLIGLELTFSNNRTVADIGDDGIRDVAATERYKAFLDNLKKSFRGLDGSELRAEAEIVGSGKDLGDDQRSKDLRVRFFNLNNEEVFWINVTRDPSVIEIQTMPVPVSELANDNSPASLVLDHLFGDEGRGFCSGSVKYGDDPLLASTQGGGHINVDAASSGLSNFKNAFELIQKWEHVDHSKTNGLLVREPQTAARLADARHYRTEKKFDEKTADYSGRLEEGLGKALCTEKPTIAAASKVYWSYPQAQIVHNQASKNFIPYGSTKQSEDELRICTHNQAINIEHLWDADENSRRVEFREFDAQKSREGVLGCWGVIEGTLLQIANIRDNFCQMDKDTRSREDESSGDETSSSSPSTHIPPKKTARLVSQKQGAAISSSYLM